MACGFPGNWFPSCTFSRTTTTIEGRDGDDDQPGPSSALNPNSGSTTTVGASSTVTTQPAPRTRKTDTRFEFKFGPHDDEDDMVEKVQRVAGLVNDVIESRRVQRGCVTCYDQCHEPCSRRCGSFGRWLCQCFHDCCIQNQESNIPDVAREMSVKYGAVSLSMALVTLQWDLTGWTQEGRCLTKEEENTLREACQQAKDYCSGALKCLNQDFFYESAFHVPGSEMASTAMPVLLSILRGRSWMAPGPRPTPPECWIIDDSKLTGTPEAPSPTDADIRRPSCATFAHTGKATDACAVKYKHKKTQKYLAAMCVKKLATGEVGVLGFEKANLILLIFEALLMFGAGPHSPLTLTGGYPSYTIGAFVRLLMLILLCCGYVPVDNDGNFPVDPNDPDDPFMKIHKQANRVYLHRETSSTSSSSSEGRRSRLMRQDSVYPTPPTDEPSPGPSQPRRSPTPAPIDEDLPPLGDFDEDDEDDDDEVGRQQELITSSSNLGKMFAAMKKQQQNQ
ncbi:hypothetical protein [Chlamydia vaughanii]|uniref:hypothetical protein n=1 Tax=Chlamydia vaughanii TaxID=3112552 RepID=UPI0032B13CA6